MATANPNLTRVPENLKKQLAIAVRSIQWSYAIFWSFSDKQPRGLEWCDGYYNGDIKTRKTVEAVELNADEVGLQRSDQLRELYESLLLGENTPQPKRPSAALSPEDLTDAEWYFLVCMSFVFNIGQGLPGRTFVKNETIWLRNAHRADTKIFSRSLLAKSASFQTVVCFPYLGGVIEIGTTELVSEDLSLIEHIKTSFLEDSSAIVSKIPNHGSNIIIQTKDIVEKVLDHAIMPEHYLDGNLQYEDVEAACSPNNCSDDFADNLLKEESNLVDGSWQFKDDAISNDPNNSSTSSSDCVSQTRGNPETIPLLDGNNSMHNGREFKGDDIHYQSVLTSLLKSSYQLIPGSCGNGNRESSFVSWKDRKACSEMPQTASPQRLLKKVLIEVAKMHEKSKAESVKQDSKEDDHSRREVEEVDKNHVLSERKRREKMNERFTILGSLVPSGGKVDKVSILDHTIEYLRELERKVEELESYKEVTEVESTTRSKTHDTTERTSDNYGPNKVGRFKKLVMNKRKGCDDSEKVGADSKRVKSADGISISVKNDKEGMVMDIRCCWRDNVLQEVMEALTKLHLDSQNVQSSNTNGILSISIRAKSKGVKGATASAIKQALQKVIKKC